MYLKNIIKLILGEFITFLLIIISNKILTGSFNPSSIEELIIVCTIVISGVIIYCANLISEKLEKSNNK